MRRAGRGSAVLDTGSRASLRELPAGQRAGRGTGLRQRVFERGQIVLAGMKLQISQQLALRLGNFLGGAGHEFHSQPRGGRSQRIALGGDVFRFDESLLFERPQYGRGLVYFLREIRRRERPAVQHAENRRGGILLLAFRSGATGAPRRGRME